MLGIYTRIIKILVLKNIINSDYEIIVFTETSVNSGIADGEFIDRSISKNPKLESGSILITVSREIFSYRMQLCESDCEDIWVTIKIRVNGFFANYTICAIYLSPPPK